MKEMSRTTSKKITPDMVDALEFRANQAYAALEYITRTTPDGVNPGLSWAAGLYRIFSHSLNAETGTSIQKWHRGTSRADALERYVLQAAVGSALLDFGNAGLGSNEWESWPGCGDALWRFVGSNPGSAQNLRAMIDKPKERYLHIWSVARLFALTTMEHDSTRRPEDLALPIIEYIREKFPYIRKK